MMDTHELRSSGAVGADAYYFEKLGEGVFHIPLCQDCMRHHFFPRMCCPYCSSQRLQWVAPSGRGTVYSTTTVRHRDGDYTVCLVDLEEGPRLMSRVVDLSIDEVHIGMAVHARIDPTPSGFLLVFTPQGSIP